MEELIRARVGQFTTPGQRVGATWVAGQGTFVRLWAPYHEDVRVQWNGEAAQALRRDADAYHTGFFPQAGPGDRYCFVAEGRTFPDPASRFQPEGVFGPSQVVADVYPWTDGDWRGIPYERWVVYELHAGAFSERHDFSGIVADLPRLAGLGVTAIELMPVAQFPGTRNWGYDGVFHHAVQHSYGGPAGLKALVDACHARGICVILDVVYNHTGPEGSVLAECGPYLQEQESPWGRPFNFEDRHNEEVRRFFLQSVWQWLTEYHIDGLRLDSVHNIPVRGAVPFVEEVSRLRDAAAEMTGRRAVLIAEIHTNDPRILAPLAQHGMGFDAQWADDFHHALQATLTGERRGYYADYGGAEQLAGIYRRGVLFEGQYAAFRKSRRGRPYDGIARNRLVVCSQNHDQVGNRPQGSRLAALAGFRKAKLAAAGVLLSPFMPMIFMGQELCREQPFLFFTSYHDAQLSADMRADREKQLAEDGYTDTPPDPADPATFAACVLTEKNPPTGSRAAAMQDYYRDLIALSPDLRNRPVTVEYDQARAAVILKYEAEPAVTVVLCFSGAGGRYAQGQWGRVVLRSGAYGEDEPEEGVLLPYEACVFSAD